jgi:hypothetical protein
MKLSVVVPRLESVWPHRRRQVAIPVAQAVLVPLLASVCPHHRRQVAVPVQLAISISPPCCSTHNRGVCTHALVIQYVKAARSGDHRAACAIFLRVSSRSRTLCLRPSTHHSWRPSGLTTAGKSPSRCFFPCFHHNWDPSDRTTAGKSPSRCLSPCWYHHRVPPGHTIAGKSKHL